MTNLYLKVAKSLSGNKLIRASFLDVVINFAHMRGVVRVVVE